MAHHSGETQRPGRRWLRRLLRVVAPLPVVAFLAFAAWSVARPEGRYVPGLVVGLVGAASYVPLAVSVFQGRYDSE